MHYKVDEEFREHFKNLKQVFMYVINECNLNCPQCIYKPNNYFTIESLHCMENIKAGKT